MILTQDVPDQDSIGSYYESEDYISHSDSRKGMMDRLYHRARSIMLDQKLKLLKQYSGLRSGHLLDIGSGTGYFMQHAQNAGWQVLGIEPNEKARTFSQEQFGLEVKDERSLMNFEDNRFDAVSMWHVLEHVHELKAYLEQIHKILKPKGIYLLALPNSQAKDAGVYKEHWAAWDVPRHLYHFNPNAIEELCRRFQFELVGKKMMPFDPFYISLLSERYRTGSSSLISGILKGSKYFWSSKRNVDQSSSIIYLLRPV